MRGPYRVIAVVGCLLGSLCAGARAGENVRKIVLPNPQLIHCRSAECSQLWKRDSGDGGVVYPAQVLTDFVNAEIVGLTAVYDKSVSRKELQAAINALYEKSAVQDGLWRVESERIVISLFEYSDGRKQVIYLKVTSGGDAFSRTFRAYLLRITDRTIANDTHVWSPIVGVTAPLHSQCGCECKRLP